MKEEINTLHLGNATRPAAAIFEDEQTLGSSLRDSWWYGAKEPRPLTPNCPVNSTLGSVRNAFSTHHNNSEKSSPFKAGADLRGRVPGVRTAPPPRPPRDDLRFSNTTGILPKKTMWFIDVEVEQETSAPPPKKNPGSAPAKKCSRPTESLEQASSFIT